MPNETNLSYIINERPSGEIVPGKTFTAKNNPIPKAEDLETGKILVETLYLSLDPGFRTMLDDRSSFNLLGVGAVMVGSIIGRVLASRSHEFKAGDLIETFLGGWQEYLILDGSSVRLVPEVPEGSRLVDMLGVLGGTGFTAYFGIEKMANVQQGDTVVVSGAAGATGLVVGQLARIKGAKKVVGIAGSDEKCKWLVDEIGYDVAFNYKTPDFEEKLADATGSNIDVYWDNVGGEILALALDLAAKHARFVICGLISGYNEAASRTPINMTKLLFQGVRMQGLQIFDYVEEWPAAREELAKLVAQKKVKGHTTLVTGGLQNVEQAWMGQFGGKNTGKLVLEVKAP